MLDIRPYHQLGTANHGWLDAHFHFSFANYFDPERLGVGALRVVNDDTIEPGGGFGMHPHRDMEIITYVRQGAITHEDSLGNKGTTRAGDIQVMSAGTGIVHSEYNHEAVATRLYQIWIYPRKQGLTPRWEAGQFPKEKGALRLLASGVDGLREEGTLTIHQDAAIWGGILAQGQQTTQSMRGAQGYLLVARGAPTVNGVPLGEGDGVHIKGEEELILAAPNTESELVLIQLPE